MINQSEGGFSFPDVWVMGPSWTAMLSHALCRYFKFQFLKKSLCKKFNNKGGTLAHYEFIPEHVKNSVIS